jgi:hypothetical protein
MSEKKQDTYGRIAEPIPNPVPRLNAACGALGEQLLSVRGTLSVDSRPSDTAREMRELAPRLHEMAEALEVWERWLDRNLPA